MLAGNRIQLILRSRNDMTFNVFTSIDTYHSINLANLQFQCKVAYSLKLTHCQIVQNTSFDPFCAKKLSNSVDLNARSHDRLNATNTRVDVNSPPRQFAPRSCTNSPPFVLRSYITLNFNSLILFSPLLWINIIYVWTSKYSIFSIINSLGQSI